jgi:hypothetical protein
MTTSLNNRRWDWMTATTTGNETTMMGMTTTGYDDDEGYESYNDGNNGNNPNDV